MHACQASRRRSRTATGQRASSSPACAARPADERRGRGRPRRRLPGLPRAVAAGDEPAGPLPLRELPAPVRAGLGLPQLRRALDDRADVEHRTLRLQPLPELDAPTDLMPVGPAGVAPSILAADFARLGEQVGAVLDAGARTIHVDIMDGHFVPALSMGPPVVEALAGQVHDAGGYVDVHLMVERPERHVAAFAQAGADGITIHAEATPHANYALAAVRDAGCRAGLALNPGTPAGAVEELADQLDLVLCMTVNPGWGGQAFLPGSVAKLERLRAVIGDGPVLEVDGGIDADTAGPCARAGATLFVAGSAVFGANDPREACLRIARAIAA